MKNRRNHSKEREQNVGRNEYLLFNFKTKKTSNALTYHKQTIKIKPTRFSNFVMGKIFLLEIPINFKRLRF